MDGEYISTREHGEIVRLMIYILIDEKKKAIATHRFDVPVAEYQKLREKNMAFGYSQRLDKHIFWDEKARLLRLFKESQAESSLNDTLNSAQVTVNIDKTHESAQEDSARVQQEQENGTLLNKVRNQEDKLNSLESDIRELKYTLTDDVQSLTKEAFNAFMEKLQTLSTQMDKKSRNLENTIDESFAAMKKVVAPLQVGYETISGKLNDLALLREIAELMEEKGVQIKRDIPPVSYDDEIMANMILYVGKVVEQLGNAARLYTRNKSIIDDIGKEREEHDRNIAKARIEAEQKGYSQAKESLIKELLSKFGSVWEVMESNELSIISAFLKKYGVVEDVDLKKGTTIKVTTENIDSLLLKAQNLEVGKRYKVIHSAYLFNSMVCDDGKAVLEIYTEEGE